MKHSAYASNSLRVGQPVGVRHVGPIVLVLERDVVLAPSLATQEVDALVVRDTEHPRFEPTGVFQRRKVVERVGECLLDNVLTVERRPAHARAEAMQPGTERVRGRDKQLPRLGHGILPEVEDPDNNPLRQMAAFQTFTAGIKDRCSVPPVTPVVHQIGTYSAT